jgi:hypothetical protein
LIAIAVIATVIATRVSGPKLDPVGLASYMPQRDDAVVLYMDVAALRDSGILEKLVGSTGAAEETEYKKFLEESGFDYKRDMDSVMVNSAADTHYILVGGRFDWDKLKNYAKSQGGACDGDFCSLKGSTPGRMVSFYPAAKNLMAMASSPNDDKAAREISIRTPVKPPYDPPQKPLWIHVPGGTLQKQTSGLPAGTRLFARSLENAKGILFSLGPQGTDKFELTMDVKSDTVENAAVVKVQLEKLTELLRTMIAREKQTPSRSDLSSVLTSGSFERQSEHVIGRWTIDKAFLDTIGK